MILSMTGYGEAQVGDGDTSYLVELRSVNNRYFKASIKLPDHLAVFDAEVEKLLRRRLVRGSVTCALRIRDAGADIAPDINLAAVRSYLAQLGPLAAEGQVRIDLAGLLTLPGVCQPPVLDEDERRRQWALIEKATHDAIDHLVAMRATEGRALRDDLLAQCASIRTHLKAVAERAPLVLQEYHQRLLQRANELLGNGSLPLQIDDIKREVAVYAERCDINEEISRLRSHLDQLERLCDSKEAAGRKLDFLAQETLREANTIGSKANDAATAHHVVEIKGAIDRLKEQIQNVV